MSTLPLSLRHPTLEHFLAGVPIPLRRPANGLYRRLQAGDQVWLREPFHLAAKFNGLSPTAAGKFGAQPVFAADLHPGEADQRELGPLRHARTLLRGWHRFHGIVRSVAVGPLQAITLEELRELGYRTAGAFAADWDRDITSFTSHRDLRTWANNPQALVITLHPVKGPVRQIAAADAVQPAQVPA